MAPSATPTLALAQSLTRRNTSGGSASPQGEARRNAPPSPSEAPGAAGRITGGGGRAV